MLPYSGFLSVIFYLFSIVILHECISIYFANFITISPPCQAAARARAEQFAHCSFCYRLPCWHAVDFGLLSLFLRVTALRVPLVLLYSGGEYISLLYSLSPKKQYSKSDVSFYNHYYFFSLQ